MCLKLTSSSLVLHFSFLILALIVVGCGKEKEDCKRWNFKTEHCEDAMDDFLDDVRLDAWNNDSSSQVSFSPRPVSTPVTLGMSAIVTDGNEDPVFCNSYAFNDDGSLVEDEAGNPVCLEWAALAVLPIQ